MKDGGCFRWPRNADIPRLRMLGSGVWLGKADEPHSRDTLAFLRISKMVENSKSGHL